MRCGQFQAEIESAGFVLERSLLLPALSENYIMVFHMAEGAVA